jgi:hypothetical protein
MQIGTSVIDSFNTSVIAPNNGTGQVFDSSYGLSFDAINAQIAMWYLRDLMDHYSSLGYTGRDLVIWALNAYNRGEGGAAANQAYGYSILWKAYGDGWDTSVPTTWGGAYMANGPTADTVQCALQSPPEGVTVTPNDVVTPSFSVPRTQYEMPWGTNSNGKAVVLFVASGDTGNYVSGYFVEQWLAQNSHVGAMLTSDTEFAVDTALGSGGNHSYLVIAVGSNAATALENYDSSLAQFSSVSAWEGSSVAGYVYASTYADCVTILSATAAAPYIAV